MTVVDDGKLTYVVQGTYYVSGHPQCSFSTVLGSCISVCLHDPVAAVGGMNHFLLAAGRGEDSGHIRFGVNAMEKLINELLKAGASRPRLQAKVFGGARMSAKLADIGRSNAAFATSFLEDEGTPVISKSIGGSDARRVIFWPSTSQARMLLVPSDSVELNEQPPPKAVEHVGAIDMF
ncbi:MAG: chemotaxis protein CheD [bacterium]